MDMGTGDLDKKAHEHVIPPGADSGYVDERQFLEAEQATPARASCTSLMTWLFRAIRPNRWPG